MPRPLPWRQLAPAQPAGHPVLLGGGAVLLPWSLESGWPPPTRRQRRTDGSWPGPLTLSATQTCTLLTNTYAHVTHADSLPHTYKHAHRVGEKRGQKHTGGCSRCSPGPHPPGFPGSVCPTPAPLARPRPFSPPLGSGPPQSPCQTKAPSVCYFQLPLHTPQVGPAPLGPGPGRDWRFPHLPLSIAEARDSVPPPSLLFTHPHPRMLSGLLFLPLSCLGPSRAALGH